MADTTDAKPVRNWVAIDIGKWAHAVLVETVNGKRHAILTHSDATRIEHRADTPVAVAARLARPRHDALGEQVLIGPLSSFPSG